MIPKQDIDIILKAAVQAPSGHNYQPWKFKILDDAIVFQNAPENDTTVYNYKQRGSMVAHGAALENAVITAETLGYACVVEVLPEESDTVLKLILSKGQGTGRASLVAHIDTRTTNRKPYKKVLEQNKLQQLSVLPGDIQSSARVSFLTEKTDIESVANAWSVNDWLIFNAHVVHDALFPHLVWTAKEEATKKSGLFIDTFELPPPVRGMFNILKYPAVARTFGAIGFGSVAAKQNVENVYASVGAIGVITVPSLTKENLVQAGRALEHVWLKAGSLGLSLQPIMGAYYLALRAEEDTALQLTSEQKTKLAEAKKVLTTTLKNVSGVPAVFFRIGESDSPSAFSSKKPPHII
ncbi:nitroreductase family protein [Patescibacteria group bacterium]|nr:nitroreductase family protein [Patescibacteria group bacterium]